MPFLGAGRKRPGAGRNQSHGGGSRVEKREKRDVAVMRGDEPGGDIRWRMHLPVSPGLVYAALDSDGGRASFWAESAREFAGVVYFRFINGFEYAGRILLRDAPTVWVVEYFGSPASFTLRSDGAGGTELLLTHEAVPVDDWQEVHAGWLNVLFPLKAYLTFGVDLRNHDPMRTWDEGYADQ